MRWSPLTIGLAVAGLAYGAGSAGPVAEDRVRAAAGRTMALFDQAARDWKIPCPSCHHQGLVMVAQGSARLHGVPVNEPAALAHTSRTLAVFASLDGAVLGSPDTLTLGYGLMAAASDGMGRNVFGALFARRLVNLQLPDGHWPVGDGRPPHASSPFTTTALASRVIGLYLPDFLAAERSRSYARARKWLLGSRPTSTEDRAFQLLGLLWADAPLPERRRAAGHLLVAQHADGGWGQLDGMPSDAYSTGEALVALRQAGELPAVDARWQRGLRFLLETQREDGAWIVKSRLHSQAPISPPFFDSGFPGGKHQFLSCAASAWAVMALMEALPVAEHPARPLPVPGLDVKATEPWVETVLFGSVAQLRRLLDDGLSPNATTAKGTGVLALAIPDLDKARLLLERGAKVDGALGAALTYRGTAPLVRLLVAHGADPDPKEGPRGNAPILAASMTGDLAVVAGLIAQGARVDPGGEGDTPLLNAVSLGNVELVRVLARAGADLNRSGPAGLTPLATAALYNRADVVRLLLELGADPRLVDRYGQTAAAHARDIDGNDPAVAELLGRAAGSARKPTSSAASRSSFERALRSRPRSSPAP